MTLITTPNIVDPDDFYAELLALHEGRSKEESDAINARLVLLLANHIGDRATLREAFDAAQLTEEKTEQDRENSPCRLSLQRREGDRRVVRQESRNGFRVGHRRGYRPLDARARPLHARLSRRRRRQRARLFRIADEAENGV